MGKLGLIRLLGMQKIARSNRVTLIMTIEELIDWHRSQAARYEPKSEPRMSGEIFKYPQSKVHESLQKSHIDAANLLETIKTFGYVPAKK